MSVESGKFESHINNTLLLLQKNPNIVIPFHIDVRQEAKKERRYY